jgi:hypothetical protein
VQRELDKRVDEERYKESFRIANSLINMKIETMFSNPEKLKQLLAYLIEEIVIYSRKRTDTDVLS